MSTNIRVFTCSPEAVFDVLADGWLFPTWVVGASRMRDVDAHWPEVGTQLHHSFGVWPVLINDATTSLVFERPSRMVIQPKGWPLGEARVELEVTPHRRGCKVVIREEAVAGPGSWIPKILLEPALWLRNVETLRRLAFIAQGKQDNRETSERDRTNSREHTS
jgi:hypothetical protein